MRVKARDNGPQCTTFGQERRRNRAYTAADRDLGGIRRNPRASRRAMAYSRSDPILPVYGSCLDYPIETID
jgi:hypothetical protein